MVTRVSRGRFGRARKAESFLRWRSHEARESTKRRQSKLNLFFFEKQNQNQKKKTGKTAATNTTGGNARRSNQNTNDTGAGSGAGGGGRAGAGNGDGNSGGDGGRRNARHSTVERLRRERVNQLIEELRGLVPAPPPPLGPSSTSQQQQQQQIAGNGGGGSGRLLRGSAGPSASSGGDLCFGVASASANANASSSGNASAKRAKHAVLADAVARLKELLAGAAAAAAAAGVVVLPLLLPLSALPPPSRSPARGRARAAPPRQLAAEEDVGELRPRVGREGRRQPRGEGRERLLAIASCSSSFATAAAFLELARGRSARRDGENSGTLLDISIF